MPNDMDYSKYPAWRYLRFTTGLSQREVERRLGWKRGHLSLIERGLPPTPEQSVALRLFYLREGETR